LFDEAAVEGADLAHSGEVPQLFEEARLSDPRLAGHDRELLEGEDRLPLVDPRHYPIEYDEL